mmetsp:Transcript_113085/g.259137  ORF Transcript_113085/g.259137 Transcript_113085/m.259137 type:complete len:123 (+) Transcript_113085:825-1193(+)
MLRTVPVAWTAVAAAALPHAAPEELPEQQQQGSEDDTTGEKATRRGTPNPGHLVWQPLAKSQWPGGALHGVPVVIGQSEQGWPIAEKLHHPLADFLLGIRRFLLLMPKSTSIHLSRIHPETT